MHRTQIYLGEDQESRLAERARRSGRTRSELIREAIDRYLDPVDDPAEAVENFHAAVLAAAGTVGRLPPGSEYVERLRATDESRRREDDIRR